MLLLSRLKQNLKNFILMPKPMELPYIDLILVQVDILYIQI